MLVIGFFILFFIFIVDGSTSNFMGEKSRKIDGGSRIFSIPFHIKHLTPDAKIMVMVCDPVKR